MPESAKQTKYTLDCHDVVHVVEFSSFEWSSQLIGIGTATRVTVGTCRFQEEAAEVEGLEFVHLRDFHHGTRVTALAWAPDTSLLTVPKVLRFATAGSDKKLRIFNSDLKAEDTVQVLAGHTDYINDVTFDPDKGDQMASVGDDQTCRIWTSTGTQKACLPLGAPGMAVKWHTDDPLKIMVAEKKGIIRFYNVLTQQPIMSLDCGVSPLLAADWSQGNSLQVAALAGSDWLVFDTSRSSRPIERRQAHAEGGNALRWCRSHDQFLVTLGAPGAQVRIFNTKSRQAVMSADLQIANGASWHYRLPLVAVGSDCQVHIWGIEAI